MTKPKFPEFLNIVKNAAGDAEINIFGVIGSSFWDDGFSKQDLLNAFSEMGDVENITVNISSLGGSLDDGLVIYDLLKAHNARVTTNIYGYTASAATVIALAGDNRNISENAMYLMHKPMLATFGNENEVSSDLEYLQKVTARLIDLYKKETNMSKAEVKKLMEMSNGNGQWISPKEAKDYGLVDNIITSDSSKALKNLSKVMLNQYQLPDPMEKFQNNAGIFGEIKGMLTAIMDAIAPKKDDEKEKPSVSPEQVQALEARITEAETQNTQLVSANEAAATENTSLTGQVADLNTRIEELTNQVNTLTAQLDEKDKKGAKGTKVGQSAGTEGGEFQVDPKVKAFLKDLDKISEDMNKGPEPKIVTDDYDPEKSE